VPTRNKQRQSNEQVSDLTAGRLSVYLRSLTVLGAAGVRTVSSRALAERFHLNAAQIRKDLAYFGEFGVRGVGYYVAELRAHLREILGLDRPVRVAILGAGNLGMALANYQGFEDEGFVIVALFDSEASRFGRQSHHGAEVFDIAGFGTRARAKEFDIAVIAVPADAAQAVVTLAVESGIRAILNFAPGAVQVPADVKLKHVDLTVSLESLSFFLARGDGHGEGP
jgi:redox-sensing transcriptional repressor